MLYPLQRDGKWGYIDESLAMSVPAEFDRARPMTNGFAAVAREGRWSFLNAVGKLIAPLQFKKAGNFAAGLSWVEDDAGFALIGEAGTVVARLPEGTPCACAEKVVTLKAGDGTYSYAGADGRVFLSGNPSLETYSMGKVAYQASATGCYGFRDAQGGWPIPPSFGGAAAFAEGLAAVIAPGDKKRRVGFVTEAGELQIPYRFETILPLAVFGEDRALIWKTIGRKERVGYVDLLGSFVIEPQFELGERFRGGIAAVQHKKKWGLIDRDGNWICRPKFTLLGEYVDRPLIWGEAGGRLGYYSRDGELQSESGA